MLIVRKGNVGSETTYHCSSMIATLLMEISERHKAQGKKGHRAKGSRYREKQRHKEHSEKEAQGVEKSVNAGNGEAVWRFSDLAKTGTGRKAQGKQKTQ